MNRRKLLAGMAMAPFAARAWAAQHSGEKMGAESAGQSKGRLLFVGTQTTPGTSKGIYTYRFNESTGELSGQELAAEIEMPTFLALSPDRKHLYSANEADDFKGHKSGGVTAFAVHGAKLTKLDAVLAGGTGTCFVSTDHTGQAVFCANYNSGSASSFHIEPSGAVSEAVSNFQYHGHGPDADRQEAPHAHRAMPSPDNRHVLVNDLGLDCIHIYKLDAGTATLTANDPPMWKSSPGAGPRALAFHPNGKWAYCVCEMGSSVVMLDWNDQAGTLTTVQTVKMIPVDYHGPTSTGCDIVITRDGKHAYAANRGYDRLYSFRIDGENGKLTEVNRIETGGKTPRHIALDPSEKFLLTANQEGDNIVVFARDGSTGRLAEQGKSFPISRPQCLVFG